MSYLLQWDDLMPTYTLFPREIFRRDEEDRRRRPSAGARGTRRSPAGLCHRRGGLTKYPASVHRQGARGAPWTPGIRGTAEVVRELCGQARAGSFEKMSAS